MENICNICGGLIRVEWTLSFEECKPKDMRVAPEGIEYRLCFGHTKREHDGNLDERPSQDNIHADVKIVSEDESFVYMAENKKLICISGGYGDIESRIIYLDTKQILSLLAWIESCREDLIQ